MSLAALPALLLGASTGAPAADWQLIEVERDGEGAYIVDRTSPRAVADGINVRVARVARTDGKSVSATQRIAADGPGHCVAGFVCTNGGAGFALKRLGDGDPVLRFRSFMAGL